MVCYVIALELVKTMDQTPCEGMCVPGLSCPHQATQRGERDTHT